MIFLPIKTNKKTKELILNVDYIASLTKHTRKENKKCTIRTWISSYTCLHQILAYG